LQDLLMINADPRKNPVSESRVGNAHL